MPQVHLQQVNGGEGLLVNSYGPRHGPPPVVRPSFFPRQTGGLREPDGGLSVCFDPRGPFTGGGGQMAAGTRGPSGLSFPHPYIRSFTPRPRQHKQFTATTRTHTTLTVTDKGGWTTYGPRPVAREGCRCPSDGALRGKKRAPEAALSLSLSLVWAWQVVPMTAHYTHIHRDTHTPLHRATSGSRPRKQAKS
jgi:hypothetical protein